ncbi:MAG TPA: WD40 repeat domain-containing protein [Umezawaea sp.]|nr:WD40 repeat domain-containing protein [Umezawaea sp.]
MTWLRREGHTMTVHGLVKVGDRTRDVRIRVSRADPDGRTLVTGSTDTTNVVWDMGLPTRLATHVDRNSTYAGAFSPDGKIVALAQEARKTTLLDLSDPREPEVLEVLLGQASPVYAVGFSPDRRTVAISGGDTPVLWDVSHSTDIVARPVDVACGIVGDGLTEPLWSTYAPDIAYHRTC